MRAAYVLVKLRSTEALSRPEIGTIFVRYIELSALLLLEY
jgi:hypothetical protein